MDFVIRLESGQLMTILKVLEERPHKEVGAIMSSIQQQVQTAQPVATAQPGAAAQPPRPDKAQIVELSEEEKRILGVIEGGQTAASK